MSRDYYEVTAIPDKEIDKNAFFDIFGNGTFSIIYDFGRNSTIFALDNKNSIEKINNLKNSLPGLNFSPVANVIKQQKTTVLSAYRKADSALNLFSDLFDLDLDSGSLEIVFIPNNAEQLKQAKSYVEATLSRRDAKETQSMLSDIFSKRVNISFQRENFSGSEEVMLLTEILESINRSLLRNGLAYCLYFIINDDSDRVEEYINSRFLVLARSKTQKSDSNSIRVLPVGLEIARNFINFRGSFELSYTLQVAFARQKGQVSVGNFMKSSVLETTKEVKIDPSSLNLGAIITGLPGSGKTNEAMALIDSMLKNYDENKLPRPSIAIISPTREWNQFAFNHKMSVITLYDEKTPINFFRCPNSLSKNRFYEDLAMILSSASNAGPYRNPMEKCMLNAFRKVYQDEKADPVHVYNAIEESIKKFHAKKTNTGYKYTKHGENIRSALENLRAILSRPEYAADEGVAVDAVLGEGTVFDLSNVSIGTKPYMYALILNQVYAYASQFSMDNDDKLNLLICVEEAQMLFKDKDTSAVQDIKSRIQDFRKQGIGLLLLTHNINDIEPSIRRLCQTKLYLKQAPDVASIAAKDLIFTYADEDAVVQKLKHLDSRVGAFSYVVKEGSNKLSQDTIFIKTKEYNNYPAGKQSAIKCPKPPNLTNMRINLSARISSEQQKTTVTEISSLQLYYLGEEIEDIEISHHMETKSKVIEGKEYTLQITNKRGKVVFSEEIVAKREIDVNLDTR